MNKDQTLIAEAYEKVQSPTLDWKEWLSRLDHYVNDDGSITVRGDVDMTSINEERFPFNFKEVTGYFYCAHNQNLLSLEGSPNVVRGAYYVRHCPKLKDLKGSPTVVEDNFYCQYNDNLVSLEGAPLKIGGIFVCYGNVKLKSIKGLPNSTSYSTDFSEEEVKRELYRQEMESKLDPETKDVFGDLLTDL